VVDTLADVCRQMGVIILMNTRTQLPQQTVLSAAFSRSPATGENRADQVKPPAS
jgi:hypothetical protein